LQGARLEKKTRRFGKKKISVLQAQGNASAAGCAAGSKIEPTATSACKAPG